MNEKDLLRGMNHIDDDLIEEAGKSPKKGIHLSNALAAGLALVVGVGAVTGGGTIISLNKKLNALEAELASQKTADGGSDSSAGEMEDNKTVGSGVGIAGALRMGSRYAAAADYGQVYDLVDRQFGDTDKDKGWGISFGASASVTEDLAEMPAEAAVEEAAEASEGAAGDSYSNTNVMTAGVDESDIVKTDGSFIYMVQSGSIQIADVREGGAPKDYRNLTVPFQSPSDSIQEMYVDDGYLTIITSHAERSDKTYNEYRAFYAGDYDSEVWVYVYDLADPMNPVLVDSMSQDGVYKTSRKVGDIVYLFTTEQMEAPAVERDQALSEDHLSEWIPSINNVPVAYDCIYLPASGYQELVASSFRVTEPAVTIDAKVIVNDYSEIYVGSSGIYLYESDYNGSHTITEITRMAYQDGLLTPGSSNTVIGSIQDSFAINEGDGCLRVLTTDWSGSTEVNTLMILDQEMQQVGRLDEIARGESIYAARFLGDKIYFITYHNSDPLFVADISDPANPRLLGNVEISGFSDYLHIWDENHILGIGYETDPNSNRQGMKVVMFDVTDPLHPVIENTMLLAEGCSWCYSDPVSSNYKAILADPVRNLIGFGYNYEMETSMNGEFNWENYYEYSVLSYSKKGFELELKTDMTYDDVNGYRGLYINDWFYIAGNAEIRTFDMKDAFTEK